MNSEKSLAKKIGDMGEEKAVNFLKSKHYEIIARNFHSRYGEIDIILEKDGYIVFVEVKTRSVNSIAAPSEWVDMKKQRKLIKTAEYYLLKNESDLQPRFDVIEIIYDPVTLSIISVEQIESAFDAEE